MAYLTKKEKALFTNREVEIKQLLDTINLLVRGFPKNCSVIGLRKIGKTMLLKKYSELVKSDQIVPVLFNVEDNFSPPEDFALRFAYAVFYTLNPEGEYNPTLAEMNKIKPKASSADEIVNVFLSEYEKRKPNRLLLLQKSFELPDKLAKDLEKYFIVILDEFQAILGLNKYREIEDVLGSIRKSFEHAERITWIISGSAISLMLKITSSSASPFFELFTNINLDFFSKENSIRLIEKTESIYEAKIERHLKERIHSFTRGHPFYIYCIVDRLLSKTKQPKMHDLTMAIFEEVLTPNARIYNHCRYVFDTSLERAKAKATLKRVLEELSRKDMLSISEIAKATKMTIQSVNVSLIRLMEVDLVERVGQSYRICDPVLRFWIRNISLGGGEYVKIKDIRVKQVEQELLKAKTELGKAKEYELKYELEKRFGLKLENYNKKVEFDLVGEKEGIVYIFEIKWRNRAVSPKDIRKLTEKIKKSEFSQKNVKAFFISKSGFTQQAKELAKEKGTEILEYR